MELTKLNEIRHAHKNCAVDFCDGVLMLEHIDALQARLDATNLKIRKYVLQELADAADLLSDPYKIFGLIQDQLKEARKLEEIKNDTRI